MQCGEGARSTDGPDHVEFLLQTTKPCVTIEPSGVTAEAETSRFGGRPFVPPGLSGAQP
ncbi:MAG: hypothetical protein GY720_17340 [bacterium]|nr:hypothetical protein [bacterium]